ncbi:ankyrin repeat domain-containing protein 26-like isoform X2 [Rhopilema esculentum]|uniref:ankyrin repeat domain-containing protein 26-like isoform X2 n=1 Tax=Rhopilema esculentum TaxID=499914 RepID=UPI0031D44E4C
MMPSLKIVSKVVGWKSKSPTESKKSSSNDKKDNPNATAYGSLEAGAKVTFPLGNKTTVGILRFIGPTKFSSGTWCGVELSKPEGRNNGTVKGVKYFHCKFNYGIFVHAEKVSLVEEGDKEPLKKGAGKTNAKQITDSRKKSHSENLKQEELNVKQLNTSVDDEWVVFGNNEDDLLSPEAQKGLKGEEGLFAKSEEGNDTQDKREDTGLKSFPREGHGGLSSADADPHADPNNMKTVLAGEVDVENSPLRIKIVKSVSEDDNNNNNNISSESKSQFADGLLFYVTGHASSNLGPKEKHKSCPALSASSDEDAFETESHSNTWPKYPKDEVQLSREHFRSDSRQRKSLSGIEKRIRLSHFRAPPLGSLKRSLSIGAVYPKENYVAYEEHEYRRPQSSPLKRSVSDVTAYATCMQLPYGKPPPVSRKPLIRREKTAPGSLQSSDSSDVEKSEDSSDEEELKTVGKKNVVDVDGSVTCDIEDIEEVSNVLNDGTDIGTEKGRSGSLGQENFEEGSLKAVEDSVTCTVEPHLEAAADVKEGPIMSADNVISSQEPLSTPLSDDKLNVSDESETDKISTSRQETRRKVSKEQALGNSTPCQLNSGLPVFSKSKNQALAKTQGSVKVPRKFSVPLPASRKDSTVKSRSMLSRECRSQIDLSSKKQEKIDDKITLPKTLNRRVSDLVANFEKTTDGPTQQKEAKTGVVLRISVGKTNTDGKRSSLNKSSTGNNESSAAKGSRRSSSSTTPRKLSQISQEELASKTTLSQQYLKEDQNKKPREQSKLNGVLSSSKSNIATPSGRSGIPGYGKRTLKPVSNKDVKDGNEKQTETPKKTNFNFRFSSSKLEKRSPSQQSVPSKDEDKSSSSSGSPAQAKSDKVQIQELKSKCQDCEKQISYLEEGMRQKNLAMEAFIVVIKQHIKTIEEQSEKQVHLQDSTNNLAKQLEVQTKLAVTNEDKFNEIEERLAQASIDFGKQIENLKIVHGLKLESLKEELSESHKKEMGQANAKFSKEIAKLKDSHEGELTELHEEHVVILAKMKEEQEVALQEQEEDFSTTKKEMELQFQTEKEEICLDYEERLQDLKAQLHSTQQKCNEFEFKTKDLQEELEKDLETKLQGALSKYKDLPAELESLQAVVEMKNEDIRKARTHNMELQKKLEDFYDLEKKHTKLLQEKEALDATLQNKVKYERQLSVERENLQANLEKEARKVKRLSMEKEELMWKVSNSSSNLSLSSPSLNIDSPLPSNGLQSTPKTSRSFNRSLKTQSLYLPTLDDEEYTVL